MYLFAPIVLMLAGHAGPDQTDVQYKEARICAIAAQPVDGPVLVSPDLRHVLFVAKKGDKQCAVLDGMEEKPYDEIRSFMLVFSPDSRRHAYLAKSGPHRVVVVDGKESKPYIGVEYSNLIFSPDSRRVGFIAEVDENYRCRVVVDGQEGPVFAGIRDLAFSPDGKHFTYTRFSADQNGEHDARAVQDNLDLSGDALQVIPCGDPINPATILHHGSKIALRFRGVTSPDYEGIDTKSIRFSPDSRRIAFWAIDGGNWRVVVDGKPHKPYHRTMFPMQPGDLEPIVWSADSRHIAYPTSHFLVLDGIEQKSYQHVGYDTIAFSPNGERLAYTVMLDEAYFVVIDGRESKRHSQVEPPVFSPDSKRVAYMIRSERPTDTWQAVVDGQEGVVYDEMGGARWSVDDGRGIFSPESKHFLCKAKRAGKWHILVDGAEGPAYDEFPQRDPITFDSPSSFHVIARRGSEYLLAEGTIQP